MEQVIVGGEDLAAKGGSPNSAGLRKSVYTEELAIQYKLAFRLDYNEGGGEFVAGPKSGSSADPVLQDQDFGNCWLIR